MNSDNGAPSICAITLVYNNAARVCSALPTMWAQTTLPTRHLIIDDGSKDDSVATIRQFIRQLDSRVEFRAAGDHRGICSRLNEALRSVREEYVVFCSDDHFAPNHLERAIAALSASPTAAAYFCAVEVVDGSHSHLRWWRPDELLVGAGLNSAASLFAGATPVQVPGHKMLECLFVQNIVPAPAVVIRTSALRGVGGYDESLPFEDYDTWFRLSKAWDWIYDPRISVQYVRHGNNTTIHQRGRIELGSAQVLLKHIDSASSLSTLQWATRRVAAWCGGAMVDAVRLRDGQMLSATLRCLARGFRLSKQTSRPRYLASAGRRLVDAMIDLKRERGSRADL